LTVEAIVADIEDEALLGFDVLHGSEKSPADILLSQNKIVLDGVEIPCFQVGIPKRVRRVVVADDVQIPGLSEALVDVYVERCEYDDSDNDPSFLLEPTASFRERYQLMMALTLVDINKAPTCKVRILNPLDTEVLLKQDAEIAYAEKVERIVSVVAEEEDENEVENSCRIRSL
jgi:hypothetical protein